MKSIWYLGMFLAGALVAPPTARAEVVAPEELIGQWVNPVPTGSLTRIQIENGSPGWGIRAWGACSPDDCEWPATTLHWVAPAVDSTAFEHAIAIWEFGFATTYVTITLGSTELLLEQITLFHDGSERSNLRVVDRMVRQAELAVSLHGEDVIVEWPVLAEEYTLVMATSLTEPEWKPVEAAPVRLGNRFHVSFPRGPGNQFFRLRRSDLLVSR